MYAPFDDSRCSVGRSLHLSLFKDVTNSAAVRAKLLGGELDCSIVNAHMVRRFVASEQGLGWADRGELV